MHLLPKCPDPENPNILVDSIFNDGEQAPTADEIYRKGMFKHYN